MKSFPKKPSSRTRALRTEGFFFLSLIAGVLVAVACGNETKPCEETQSCLPTRGDDGGGGNSGGTSGASGGTGGVTTGGAGHGGAGTGGTDDGGGGTGETGGTDGGAGMGGTSDSGAGGSDDEPPRVVSFTPSDGEVDVDRNVEITAELDEPIDEETVTSTSVTLEGPEGEVSGSLSVDRNVIAFVPHEPLHLLGTYTFTLGDTLADRAGNRLYRSERAEFRVRDGAWREPVYPFGRATSLNVTGLLRNASGDAVVGLDLIPNHDAAHGAVYDMAQDQWTPAAELHSMSGSLLLSSVLGIDASKRALVSWGYATSGFGWARFKDGDWTAAGFLEGYAAAAITPAGAALAITWDNTNRHFVFRTHDLSTGTVGPATPRPELDFAKAVYPVASRDRMAILVVRDVTGGQELTAQWEEGSDWGAPQQLATASAVDSVVRGSDEQGNILVVWRERDEIWSRGYERSGDRWAPKAFVTTATLDAILTRPDMTAGRAALTFQTTGPKSWAAVYEAGVGWIQDSIIELDAATFGSAGVAIDPAGNALAVWPTGPSYRRYVHGAGWQAAEVLGSFGTLPYTGMWATAAPNGTVLAVGNDATGPWAMRFE